MTAFATALAQPQAPSAAALTPASPAKRAQVDKTAKAFEASFISSMLGPMFDGTDAQAPFGGGQGESAFRSFLTDAISKSMAGHGGIGLSKAISAEMLKMQGLS